MQQNGQKTVLDVLKGSTDFLAGREIEQPRLAAELLLSRLLNCKRLNLYVRHEELLSERILEAMRRGVKRVAANEPIQYVLGQTEFMGRVFRTDRRALIPRPETETLVETVLSHEPLWKNGGKPAILDVGTGTGCIAVTIAAARPEAVCVGFDVSAEAIELAKENATANGVATRTAMVCGPDLSAHFEPEMFDAVVANLPYIPTKDCETLAPNVRDHEPRLALDGGPDGLSLIAACIEDAAMLLKPAGTCFLETGADQTGAVSLLFTQNGFENVVVKKDLAGRDRIVFAARP